MKRQVFFSFHFDKDVWRVGQVRNMGVVEGQELFSDNGWEKVRLQSDYAIKQWIDKEMKMRSCAVVLIGSETAERDWVKYEIKQAWEKGKGIVGVYINKLEDSKGNQSVKGKNPFDDFYLDKTLNYIAERDYPMDKNDVKLSNVCKTFESSFCSSKCVYDDIKNNIENLIEESIYIRNQYPK